MKKLEKSESSGFIEIVGHQSRRQEISGAGAADDSMGLDTRHSFPVSTVSQL